MTDGALRFDFRHDPAGDDPIDADWWPRSDDLSVELPSLLRRTLADGFHIDRVTYSQLDWRTAPAMLMVDGHNVLLAGFRSQNRGAIRLLDTSRRIYLDVAVTTADQQRAGTE